ncbi:MAG TPA: MerR family transcriptional regulator [Acidimicrobiales bacterium]|nr:MerR family transcriptional regulator [Acidimicrobiales bacterium]
MSRPRRNPSPDESPVFRIGEMAKLCRLTTRTLRYWEELGLVSPSSHGRSGDRLYTVTDMTRVNRIRDLQDLLGFSLAEVRVVLDTDEMQVLDRVRSEFRAGEPSPARQRELIDEAIVANDRLLARLDDTLARIAAFRDERRDTAARLRERTRDLGDAEAAAPTPPGRTR